MLTTEFGPKRRVLIPHEFPKDSFFYEKLSPDEWKNRISILYLLEALQSLPLRDGSMTHQDINKLNNLLIALAFGKTSVPFVAVVHADDERLTLNEAYLINDAFLHTGTEKLERPQFFPLDGNPVRNVRNLRKAAKETLLREADTITPDGGLSIAFADAKNHCHPGVFAFGGAYGVITAGRLFIGEHERLLTVQNKIPTRNASMSRR